MRTRARAGRRATATALAALVALVAPACLAGCAGSDARETLTLRVAAAASLEPVFSELGPAFTAAHPDVDLAFTYDGSSVLATQIVGGAPVDVFASADAANMDRVTESGMTGGEPEAFATSELQIAVTPGNPLHIAALSDLAAASDGVAPVVVVCAPEVPCGAAGQTLLERDDVAVTPASEEQNVTAVLTKIVAGEADAGLVYRSDVRRADGDVVGIEIPDAADAAGDYLIAPIGTAGSADVDDAARRFTAFLRSDEAQRRLADLGFGAPRS